MCSLKSLYLIKVSNSLKGSDNDITEFYVYLNHSKTKLWKKNLINFKMTFKELMLLLCNELKWASLNTDTEMWTLWYADFKAVYNNCDDNDIMTVKDINVMNIVTAAAYCQW